MYTKTPPNIVIIFADDMGYGDIDAENTQSKVDRPNLDKLRKMGLRLEIHIRHRLFILRQGTQY